MPILLLHQSPAVEGNLRNLVVWLDDMKIRHYKIQEREGLRHIDGDDWNSAFTAYLRDLEFPRDPAAWCQTKEAKLETLDWLLGYAVALEYADEGSMKSLPEV